MLNRNEPLSNEQIQLVAPSVFAGQPYGGRSDRYTFIPTSAVVDSMRENGYLPFSAQQSRSRIPGKEFFTKHIIRFRPTGSSLVNVDDSELEIVLINSHDATSAYELMLGAFRLVCANGLIVSESLVKSLHIRHTGNILDSVIDGTENLIQQAPAIERTIEDWKRVELIPEEQRVFAEAALTVRFGNHAPITADRLLVPRRYQDSGTDLWSVFNRVQENAVKGGVRYTAPGHVESNGGYVQPRRNRTRTVTSIDRNTDLNKAIWTLAEKMATFKS